MYDSDIAPQPEAFREIGEKWDSQQGLTLVQFLLKAGAKLARALGLDSQERSEGILTPTIFKSKQGNVAGLHKEDYSATSINHCYAGDGVKIWTAFHAQLSQELLHFIIMLVEPRLQNKYEVEQNNLPIGSIFNANINHEHHKASKQLTSTLVTINEMVLVSV